MLWKIYNNISDNLNIPKFGLNFVVNENFNEKFLLLCGFERFKDYFIRIDILEKLFINIIDKTVDRKFKISPEMMNLLGCTKENFYRLLDLMNYKKLKDSDIYYFFQDNKRKKERIILNKNKANPFSKLLALNIK
jgi:ATP-dependent RNA helicase SUPV3L1/SUV3